MNVQSSITGNATLDEFPYTAKPAIFDLQPVTTEEVIEAINRRKSSQSCGIDVIISNMLALFFNIYLIAVSTVKHFLNAGS